MIEQEKQQKIVKWGIFLGLALLLFLLFFFGFSKDLKKEDIAVKEKTSYLHNDTLISRLPYITLKGSDASFVNKEMSRMYYDVVKRGDAQFTYRYSKGGKYLSIVTMVGQMDEEEALPYPTFKTYVFDLNTKKLLTNEELLDAFKTTKASLAASFEKKMQKYYQEELDSGYLKSEECDYACFLSLRGISDYHDNIKLYVENDTLKFYRGFLTFSSFGEEDYYRNETFLFEIGLP